MQAPMERHIGTGGGPDGSKEEGCEEGRQEGREAVNQEEELAQEVARKFPGGLRCPGGRPRVSKWKSCSAPHHQRRRSKAAAPRASRSDWRIAAEAVAPLGAGFGASTSG